MNNLYENDQASLDHDTEIHIRGVLGQLDAAGVHQDEALDSIKRVLKIIEEGR